MEHLLFNLRLLIGAYLSYYPQLFFPLLRLFGHKKRGRASIGEKTKIVIDGFPRSANTFAYNAFLVAEEGKVKPDQIAHHIHKSAQIIRATEMKIPVILLIREPREAILSLKVRQPKYSIGTLLKVYILFYSPLIKLREKLVIAHFKEVISEFGSVIKRVNEKFDTHFTAYDQINDQLVFEKIKNAQDVVTGENPEERVAVPNEQKKLKKEELMKQLELESSLLKKAEKVYSRFVGN